MASDITFLWFLLFSMCHSLHVAINKCINWCFVHLSHTGLPYSIDVNTTVHIYTPKVRIYVLCTYMYMYICICTGSICGSSHLRLSISAKPIHTPSLLHLPQLLNSCPASMVSFIWYTDDKMLKFYHSSYKKRPKQSLLHTCGDSLTFTPSSKTVHQHTSLVRWLSFGIVKCLISRNHVAQCWYDEHFSSVNQIKFTIKAG